MKKLLLVILVFLSWATAQADFSGVVIRAIDGDTFEVLQKGTTATVRLWGIDCPEKNQEYGLEAKRAAEDLVLKKSVTVKEEGKDRYGRVLGIVNLEDKIIVNNELVRIGMAWWYEQYAPIVEVSPVDDINIVLKSDEASLFRDLETKARKEKIGLWAAKKVISPWKWRKRNKGL